MTTTAAPAVSLGLAANYKEEDYVTLCIFGDGSVGEGEFHESLNLATIQVPAADPRCTRTRCGLIS